MSGLREALEKALATLPVMTHENGYPVQAMPKAELLGILQAQTLAEPAPVASRERVAEVVREALSFESGHAHGHLLTQQANRIAHRLLAAGVFRDEAQVKAEALEEAAEHIHIPRASSLAAAWLQGRATKLRAGEPS